MIFPKAKKIAKELDWYKTKNGVFGIYKDYFFNVSDASLFSNPQFKFVIATTDILTDEQKAQLKFELDANKNKLKFSTFEISDGRILFQFIENLTFTKLKTVYSLFDFLVELFKKLNISEQSKCLFCYSKENNKYCDMNDFGTILCSSCFNQTEKSYIEIENDILSKQKNYLTGFLGALLFSIPGIIAWVLAAIYFEILASGMAIIIGLLGIKGYDYFKGKQGNLTKYLIVLTNIISIITANVFTVVVMLMNEGLTISNSIIEFQTNEIAKDLFYKNTIISFVLAIFIWIWLLFVYKNKKLSLKKSEKFNK